MTTVANEVPGCAESSPSPMSGGLTEAGLPGGHLTVLAPVFILNGSTFYLVLCNELY